LRFCTIAARTNSSRAPERPRSRHTLEAMVNLQVGQSASRRVCAGCVHEVCLCAHQPGVLRRGHIHERRGALLVTALWGSTASSGHRLHSQTWKRDSEVLCPRARCQWCAAPCRSGRCRRLAADPSGSRCAITCRLLGCFCPRRDMRGDAGANQPAEELARTVSGIGSKTFGLETEATFGTKRTWSLSTQTSSELRAGVARRRQ